MISEQTLCAAVFAAVGSRRQRAGVRGENRARTPPGFGSMVHALVVLSDG
jgi:hypothetical protein